MNMQGTMISRQKKTKQIRKQISPITELYLRQFFINYGLQQKQRQHKNMYLISIEVLDTLIGEYEQKFGIECLYHNSQFVKEQNSFQQFYNRIKNIFEIIQLKLNQSQKHIYKGIDNGFDVDIFNDSNTYEQSKSRGQNKCLNPHCDLPQRQKTDDQLYQLVVQLKKQSNNKAQKIKVLEKQLLKKNDQLDLIKQKLKYQLKENKIKQHKIYSLLQEINLKNAQNDNLSKNIKTLEEKILLSTKFNQTYQKQNQNFLKYNQTLNNQIKILKQVESHYISEVKITQELQSQKNKLNERIIQLETSNINLQKYLNGQKQSKNNFQKENHKLKKIIYQKLAFLNENKSNILPNTQIDQINSQNKQNTSLQRNQDRININRQFLNKLDSSQSCHNYFKSIIEQKLTNNKLIRPLLETEINTFLKFYIGKHQGSV